MTISVRNDNTAFLRIGLSNSNGRMDNLSEKLGSGKAQIRSGDDIAASIMGSSLQADANTMKINAAEISKGLAAADMQDTNLQSAIAQLSQGRDVLKQALGMSGDIAKNALIKQANSMRSAAMQTIESCSFNGIKLLSNSSIKPMYRQWHGTDMQEHFGTLKSEMLKKDDAVAQVTAFLTDSTTKFTALQTAATDVESVIDDVNDMVDELDSSAAGTIGKRLTTDAEHIKALYDAIDSVANIRTDGTNSGKANLTYDCLQTAGTPGPYDDFTVDLDAGDDASRLAALATGDTFYDSGADKSSSLAVYALSKGIDAVENFMNTAHSGNDPFGDTTKNLVDKVADATSAGATITLGEAIDAFKTAAKDAMDEWLDANVEALDAYTDLTAQYDSVAKVMSDLDRSEGAFSARLAVSAESVDLDDDSTYMAINATGSDVIVDGLEEVMDIAAEALNKAIGQYDDAIDALEGDRTKVASIQASGKALHTAMVANGSKIQAAADAYLNADAADVTAQLAAERNKVVNFMAALTKSIQTKSQSLERLLSSI